MGTHPIFESDFDCLTEMIFHKKVPKIKNDSNDVGIMRKFDGFRFTLLTYFCFGTFSFVLIRKIGDLQAQIRSVQLERDFLTDERTSPMMRYFDEPEEFKNVKDVPAIFTVNNLNFTHGTTEECWCDQPMIERQIADTGMRSYYKDLRVDYMDGHKKMNTDRKNRHMEFQKRNWESKTILFNNPSIPVIYPTSGLEVEPNGVIINVPIKIIKFFQEVEIKITSKFGSFGVAESEDQRALVLSGSTSQLNEELTNLRYTNLMYDTRKYTDLVTLWIRGFPPVYFEIQIRRVQLDLLPARDPSQAPGTINEKITIIVKTYRRHHCLDRLVKSIRKMYPLISIIIADDSPAEMINESEIVRELETDKHIRYFKLPQDNGWNSGRALLISQVQTEYFDTSDGDWFFNEGTSLEKFLDVIENTGFDPIGGLVGGESMIVGPSNSFFNNWLNYGNYKIKKGASGNCISREFGFRGPLPGYEKCQACDIVINFFIARTLTAGTVRMDGLFKQIGHQEYFLDGIGKLRIAVCGDIHIGHDSQCTNWERNDGYWAKRQPWGQDRTELFALMERNWYQRNYLSCTADLE